MSEPGPHNLPDDALVDLIVKQVTEGLSPAEQRELDVLDSESVSGYLRDFERAAAAITVAGTTPMELPAALRASIERQAAAHVGRTVLAFEAPPRGKGVVPVRSAPLGWYAAAACLVLAVFGWMRTPPVGSPPTPDVNVVALPPPPLAPVVIPPPPAPPTPTEERLALLSRSDALKVTLGPTKDPAAVGVTGDVVWDPVTQRGYLHFVGLAANDPKAKQYQIWIFDGSRDKRYPVDAGVFDVPADSAEVVIPIHASLFIDRAKAFAVTVEKPGGVVVSGLGHVVALGATG